MELSKELIKTLSLKLLRARMKLLFNHPFYGALLLDTQIQLEEGVGTAATDGKIIYFDPQFLEKLNEKEVTFILQHEVLHMVLQHCFRETKEMNHLIANIAADIVVNSNILYENQNDTNSIKVMGVESMHLTPKGDEGYKYTFEEVYKMLLKKESKINDNLETTDNHSKWGTLSKDEQQEIIEESIAKITSLSKVNAIGDIPLCVKELLKEYTSNQVNWREVLQEFVQLEINDYSLVPPDRRFQDSPFILPDFNDGSYNVKKILFMIDVSGSMAIETISTVYGEIKNAIAMYSNKLSGWVGTFDAKIHKVQEFTDGDLEIKEIEGRGGTDVVPIFEYVFEEMKDDLPACIIILTDGWFIPVDKEIARGIPVLWVIADNKKFKASFGKIVHINTQEK